MPYSIRKLPNKDLYRVYNTKTKEIHSYGTTLENAKKQIKLLHMVDAGVPLTKNKDLENNNISNINMNPWIEHVKAYASKNGISYRDSLRCSNCKENYKKGSGTGCSKSNVVIPEETEDFADVVPSGDEVIVIKPEDIHGNSVDKFGKLTPYGRHIIKQAKRNKKSSKVMSESEVNALQNKQYLSLHK